MRSLPLKALKESLSEWIEAAHQGNIIEITKYNQPYASLGPISDQGVHRGAKVGHVELEPLLQNATRGQWQSVLDEDRKDRF